MKTSEVLNRAADLIEERGWTRGCEGWEGGDGFCLEGGLIAALGRGWKTNFSYADIEASPAYLAVREYLDTEMPLYYWNDDQESAEPVIEALRAAAVIEAAKEDADPRAALLARVSPQAALALEAAANPSPADDLAGLLVEAELGAS